jgi:hypothetical protein
MQIVEKRLHLVTQRRRSRRVSFLAQACRFGDQHSTTRTMSPLTIPGWTQATIAVIAILSQLKSLYDPSSFMITYDIPSIPAAKLIGRNPPTPNPREFLTSVYFNQHLIPFRSILAFYLICIDTLARGSPARQQGTVLAFNSGSRHQCSALCELRRAVDAIGRRGCGDCGYYVCSDVVRL